MQLLSLKVKKTIVITEGQTHDQKKRDQGAVPKDKADERIARDPAPYSRAAEIIASVQIHTQREQRRSEYAHDNKVPLQLPV